MALSTIVRSAMLCLLLTSPAWSQQNVNVQEQTWLGYFNQSRLSDRSGVWLDVHLRFTDDFIRQTTVSIVRTAYIHYISEQWRGMAGYAYANRYNTAGGVTIPEHRFWQQLQWLQRKKHFNLTQAVRIEQRLRGQVSGGELTGEYNFNWRFRYNITFTVPLKGQIQARTPFLLAGNEVMANAGRIVGNKYFDQNRSFLSLGYQFTQSLNAHAGYLFIVQQDAAVNRFQNIHVLRLFVVHSVDLRKRQ